MKEISMLQFRRHAKRWLEAVQAGERFVLTYRGEPVARLEPVRPQSSAIPDDDPIFRVDDYAVDGAGGRLTNEEVDLLIYGS